MPPLPDARNAALAPVGKSSRVARREVAALQTLFDVCRVLASTLDFPTLLERMMTLSMQTIGSETASVMLADTETGILTLVCSHGLPEDVRPGTHRSGDGGGIAEWVYRQGEPVLLQGNPSDDPRFRSADSREHIHSALSVPLVGRHGPIGVLSLNNSTRREHFTPDDLDLLSAIGTQAGIAVENARLHEQVAETNRQLAVTVEQLRNLTSSLTSMTAPSLDASLQTMLDAAVEGTGAQSGSLTVLDQGDASYQIEAVNYDDGILLASGVERWSHAVDIVTGSFEGLAGVSDRPSHTLIRVLTAKGEPIGLLKLIAAPDGPGFGGNDREFVDALVEHASIVVYNSMLYQQAEAGRLALQQAYTELREKQEQLIQSEKLAAIGQLAARVCHEINNPLTAISGCAQLMQRKLRSEPDLAHAGTYERYIGTIASETERCSRITGELLQFTRKRPLICHPYDLHDVLNQTVALLQYRDHSLHEVVADFDFEMPRIMGDAQQMTQVFLNLMTNAADAMPEGGRISVTTRWIEGPHDGHACITVSDQGSGLPEEAGAHIFEPFYTTKSTGTGLGLTICRDIVGQHHGTLRLANARDGGAVATVILPIAANASPVPSADLSEKAAARTSVLAEILSGDEPGAPPGGPGGQPGESTGGEPGA